MAEVSPLDGRGWGEGGSSEEEGGGQGGGELHGLLFSEGTKLVQVG
jgi:hypothetical protein